MTTQAPPDGWSKTDEKAKIWLRGSIFIWARGFTPASWLDLRQAISIRPGETGAEAYQRERGEALPPDTFVFFVDR